MCIHIFILFILNFLEILITTTKFHDPLVGCSQWCDGKCLNDLLRPWIKALICHVSWVYKYTQIGQFQAITVVTECLTGKR